MFMEDFSIKSLKEFTGNFKGIHLDTWDNEDIDVPFEITPRQFLQFAEYDLNNRYEHHLVNSLSNIKRTIDCQLDSLLFGFGLFQKSKKERWNFPKKVDTLSQVGIISPRILEKINQKRNLLEHEYRTPEKGQVEDALDVATLFIAYTEKFLFNALTECRPFHDIKEDAFEVELDYKGSKIIFFDTELKNNKLTKVIKKEVTPDSDQYLEYLSLFIGLYKLK